MNIDADGISQELNFLLRIPMYRPKNSTGIYQNLDMRLQYMNGGKKNCIDGDNRKKEKQLTTVRAKGRTSKFCCMWCM